MSNKEYHPDDDAEFEEFLQGRGELARHLQALPQAAPSAELDQAIMAKVEAGLKQAVPPAMPAANDARIPDSEAGQRTPIRRRWWLGAPLTTAASVAIVGFLGLQWQHQLALDAPASPPVPVAAPAQAGQEAGAGAGPQTPQTPQTPQPPVSAAAPTAAPVAKVSPSTPAPAPAPAAKMAAPMAKAEEAGKAAVAPARLERADAAPAAPSQTGRIDITGSAIRSAAPIVAAPAPLAPPPAPIAAPLAPSPPAAPIAAPAAPAATAAAQGAARFAASDAGGASRQESEPARLSQQQAREASDWLALIEELLKAGLRQDALSEWKKFHQAYPDYPVPDQVTEQIKTLQK